MSASTGAEKGGTKMKSGAARLIHPGFGRIFGLIIFGSLLAGCDRCGDWWGAPDQSESCKGQLPAQH
jgi:hypothetical protein